jgi:hypothetical protein
MLTSECRNAWSVSIFQYQVRKWFLTPFLRPWPKFAYPLCELLSAGRLHGINNWAGTLRRSEGFIDHCRFFVQQVGWCGFGVSSNNKDSMLSCWGVAF